MATAERSDARLNFRLSSELEQLIEDAAARLGQSVSDSAVSTLADKARNVVQEASATRLSARDREIFIAMLDDTEAKPNRALRAAIRRYKRPLKFTRSMEQLGASI